MVRQNGLVRLGWLTIIWVLVTAGCGDGGRGGVSSTATAGPTTVTLTVSPLPSHTPTPTQAPTTRPTAAATKTPVPTLTAEEAMEGVRDLFENNAGCRLPCWWGLIPGETEWIKAQNFLSPYASGFYTTGSIYDPEYYMEAYIPTPSDILQSFLLQRYTIRQGIIGMIEMDVGNIRNYYLHQFLNDYGPPLEVWLSTYSEPREDDLPFSMALFYGEQGIMIVYGNQADKEAEKIVACFDYYLGAHLSLWSPDENLTFEEVAKQTITSGPPPQHEYLELGEVTGMDVMTFYEAFRNIDNTACLETPAELWPSP